jgi:aminoglycoside 3-N-acetyltransferase I
MTRNGIARLEVRRVSAGELDLMRSLNALFAAVFADPESYERHRPTDDHLREVLAKDHVIALAALIGGRMAGGLVAYELDKLEQARREIYLYDLAVAHADRRQGVATALIRRLQAIARARGAYVVFVQADHGDDAAIALYEKLGVREEVLHFDLRLSDSE